ncbi:MAG: hypothetical protein ACM3QY_01000 [Candidatus Levyibacteriota bacterium]
MSRGLVMFWSAALALALGVFAVLFHYAAVPEETLARSRVPQPMDKMGTIDLGGAYGTVSVADLVGYYIEHPPAAQTAPALGDQGSHHFRGC